MEHYFTNAPWWIHLPVALIMALAGSIPDVLPDWTKPYGPTLLWAIAGWIVIAFVWHAINVWTENNGKPRLHLEPNYLIVLGIAIAAVGVGWQIYRGPQLTQQQIEKITAPLKTEIDNLRGSLGKALQQKAAARPTQTDAAQNATLIPNVRTAPIDVPRKLEAIDALRSILADDVDPWITKAHALINGGWWTLVVKNEVPQLRDDARDFWHKGKEIDEKLQRLQKENEQFPDIHALAQSPLGTPYLLKMQHFVTPILALPNNLGDAIQFYRSAIEAPATQASQTLSNIKGWRIATDRKALELRQQLSR